MPDDPSATERRAQVILQELLRAGKVSVLPLAKRLKVSSATIRRDLSELELRGLLRRSHGGTVPVQPLLYEPFRHVSSYHAQGREKRRIGLIAVFSAPEVQYTRVDKPAEFRVCQVRHRSTASN